MNYVMIKVSSIENHSKFQIKMQGKYRNLDTKWLETNFLWT